jgi:outer membrane protein assembly factor BamD (BamD/ComL family)
MQQNKIYAQILESQGFFKEAFVIYQTLLQKYPNDNEIKTALKRLKKIRDTFNGLNVEKRDFFINMKTDKEFHSFEEWLIEGF